MKFNSLFAFEKYLEKAGVEKFSPFYLILGKEFSECQEAIDALLHFLMPSKEERRFALTILDGLQIEEAALENALYSTSFFAKLQVIWIRQIEKLRKSTQENLEKYFQYPSCDKSLILSASQSTKNMNFYKTIEKEGVILDLTETKPWEREKYLVEWVNKQIAAAHKLMSYQVCQVLVKRLGNEKSFLLQEIEKLLCYCNDKKEITIQDVEAICSAQYMDSIWQLGEAIFCRDSFSALQTAQMFLMEGRPLLSLLRQIRSQFQVDYQVALLLTQGKHKEDITLQFPYIKGKILDRHMQRARQYGLRAFKHGLLALNEAEMRAKNSSVNERILLEILIIQLTNQRFIETN